MVMADSQQTEQFIKSWWQWRNELPGDQKWMADAMAWSAAHGGDVQGYDATAWSWDQVGTWLRGQDADQWQAWSKDWKSAEWSR
jgi:hypothetical protein